MNLTRERLIASIEQLAAQRALDAVYREINALGGTVEPGDTEGVIRMQLLDEVLDILDRHGATDLPRFPMVKPLPAEAVAAYSSTEA